MLQINKKSLFLFWAICFLPIESVLGQWATQNINLKPGWNGVYLTPKLKKNQENRTNQKENCKTHVKKQKKTR